MVSPRVEGESRSKEHALALRAATAPAEEAAEAWQALMTVLPFDEISEETQRVLPAIFANIHQEPNVPELSRLRGVYRNAWVRNQQLLYGVHPVLQELARRGIDYRVTKGMAVLHLVETLGSRVMSDVDIVVRAQDVDDLRRIMSAYGFRSSDPPACVHRIPSVSRDALNFNRGSERIDVHVSPFREPERLFTAMLNTDGVQANSVSLALADPALVMINAMVHGNDAFSRTDRIQALVDVHHLSSIVTIDGAVEVSESLGLGRIVNEFLDHGDAFGMRYSVSRRPADVAAGGLRVKPSGVGVRMVTRFRARLDLIRARSIRLPIRTTRRTTELKHALAYRIWVRLGKSAKLESRACRWFGGFLAAPHESLPMDVQCRPFDAERPRYLAATSFSQNAFDWRFGFRHEADHLDIVLQIEDDALDEADAFVLVNGDFVTKIVGGDLESRTVFLREVPPRAEVSIRPLGAACTGCYPTLDGMQIRMKVVGRHA